MKTIEPITPQGLGFFPVLNLPWKPVSGKNPEPDLNHLGKLPGSKTAESPSVPASEPDRTQWLQWFDSFDLPYFTHGFRWRWMVLDGHPLIWEVTGFFRRNLTIPWDGPSQAKPPFRGWSSDPERTHILPHLGSIWNFEFQMIEIRHFELKPSWNLWVLPVFVAQHIWRLPLNFSFSNSWFDWGPAPVLPAPTRGSARDSRNWDRGRSWQFGVAQAGYGWIYVYICIIYVYMDILW